MRLLLKGDFIRIVKKKSFWIILVLACYLLVEGILTKLHNGLQNSFTYMAGVVDNGFTAGLLFGLVILLSVYGDEFRSMTFISVIGRGIPRWKLILAKFLDSLFLLLSLFLLYTVAVIAMRYVTGFAPTTDEIQAIGLSLLVNVYDTMCCVTIAAIFLYLTGNTPFAIFIYLTLTTIMPMVLLFAQTTPVLQKYHLDRYYLSGFSQRAAADLMYGATVSGIGMLLLGALIYIGGALLITWFIFRDKELEF